jgi:hypothetical protein
MCTVFLLRGKLYSGFELFKHARSRRARMTIEAP